MTNINEVVIKIEVPISRSPIFGLYKWSDNDFKIPLKLKIGDSDVRILLQDSFSFQGQKSKKSDIIPYSKVFIYIKIYKANNKLINGLIHKTGKNTEDTIEMIYKTYSLAMEKFEILLRTKGNVKNLFSQSATPKTELFQKSSAFSAAPVTYSINKNKFINFEPIIHTGRKKRYALFKVEQLITQEKWKKMQRAIDKNEYVSPEIIELLCIQSKLYGNDKKIATLESAMLLENLLREYARKILKEKGLSETKIKSLKDELSFNNILNMLLPFIFKKAEIKKLQNSINAVDKLRKIRNDIVHGEKKEEDINEDDIKKGIEAGLRLIKILV